MFTYGSYYSSLAITLYRPNGPFTYEMPQMKNPHGTHTLHFERLHQYSVQWHFRHVQEACQCSRVQISIIFNNRSNVVGIDYSYRSSWPTTLWCMWNNLQPSLNSLCHFLMFKLLRHCLWTPSLVIQSSLWAFLQAACKIQCKCAAWFSNSFSETRTILHLTCTVSLPASKNHTIYHMTFILALCNAENIPLSENTVVVRASFTCVPPPLFKDKDIWLTEVDHYTLAIRAVSCMLFNTQGLSHTLLPYFEPLYTNMYHVGPLDGTVLHYMFSF